MALAGPHPAMSAAGFALAYSRARLVIVSADMEVIFSAHFGVLGTPSSAPNTYYLNFSNPIVYLSINN